MCVCVFVCDEGVCVCVCVFVCDEGVCVCHKGVCVYQLKKRLIKYKNGIKQEIN